MPFKSAHRAGHHHSHHFDFFKNALPRRNLESHLWSSLARCATPCPACIMWAYRCDETFTRSDVFLSIDESPISGFGGRLNYFELRAVVTLYVYVSLACRWLPYILLNRQRH
jgi:hypothetical protein